MYAGSSEPSPHADVIRTIISCADQFIVLIPKYQHPLTHLPLPHRLTSIIQRDSIYSNKYRILGECLSLPGKALRHLLTSRGFPSDSTCVLKAELGELNIKIHEPDTCILFINSTIVSIDKLAIME